MFKLGQVRSVGWCKGKNWPIEETEGIDKFVVGTLAAPVSWVEGKGHVNPTDELVACEELRDDTSGDIVEEVASVLFFIGGAGEGEGESKLIGELGGEEEGLGQAEKSPPVFSPFPVEFNPFACLNLAASCWAFFERFHFMRRFWNQIFTWKTKNVNFMRFCF